MAEELCVQLVPLFQELSLDNQRQVEKLVHHQHALKGNILASPGKSDYLVIIEHGSAKMYQLNETGNEQLQRNLGSGDYVGQSWLFGTANTSSYVEATSDCQLCIIERNDFIGLLERHSDIAIKLLESQSKLINNLRQQNQLMGLPNIEERIVGYLQLLKNEQHSSEVVLPLKLKDLASYLGTTPETISRQFKSLEKKNYLAKHGRNIKLL